ncbi:MAG TPA: dihydrofolate reductase family protein [Polyangiales bacterium]|nr:dihydrofolate reductase family protein [Polyangiales bacterium]
MRKILSSTYATLDGFIDDPHLWSMQYSDGRSQSYAFTMTLAADALLLGRTTYEGMAQAWPAMGGNPYADHVNTITKYVVASARRHDRKASARKVELVDTTAFATGAVVHTYRPLAR